MDNTGSLQTGPSKRYSTKSSVKSQKQNLWNLLEAQLQSSSSEFYFSQGQKLGNYANLYEAVLRLSSVFQERGFQAQDVLLFQSEKGLPLLAAFCACQRLGIIFCAIDSDSSENQQNEYLFTSHARALIQQSQLESMLEEGSKPKVIEPYKSKAEDIAYLVFTSGTTGKAKAVAVSHASITSRFYAWQEAYDLVESDCHLQMAKESFDVFIGDVVRSLASGASICFVKQSELLDSELLYQSIIENKVSITEFVPEVLRHLLRYCQEENKQLNIARLICGSDAWHENDYELLLDVISPSTRFINSYGLSETTVDATYLSLQADNPLLPNSIGSEFPNVEVFLIDKQKRELPKGAIGEICVSGGIASEYWKDKEATRNAFFNKQRNGESVAYFSTGDLGVFYQGNNSSARKIKPKYDYWEEKTSIRILPE